MNIDTSLLRERFIIKETKPEDDESSGKTFTIEARSNRMVLNLQAGKLPTETFIIRTDRMHTCARMVSLLIADYEKMGPISPRAKRIEWFEMWDKSLSHYERTYNPDRWIAIYQHGKPIYKTGHYHSFLDVIEQCDALNKGDYPNSLAVAEKAFKQAGKDIKIEYDSSIALVAILGKESGRCSMLLRAPDRTTTFNYSLKPLNPGERVNVTQGLSSASDFLEGVQLSYMVGINAERVNQGMTEKFSDESKQAVKARDRIDQLNAQINSMESRYKIMYRPERPMFEYLMGQAEKYARNNMVDEDEVYIE